MRRLPRPDARVLVWLALLALASGLPLMLWFRTDAIGWPSIGQAVRALHAAASFALLAGLLWHAAARLWHGPRSRRGARTGAWALLAVGAAVLTGALAAQTDDARRVQELAALARFDGVVLWAAMAHVAFVSLAVVAAVLVHVRGMAWAALLDRHVDAVAALVAAVVPVVVMPLQGPGGPGLWTTRAIAPPVPWLWAWPLVLGLVLYAVAPWLGGSAGRQTS